MPDAVLWSGLVFGFGLVLEPDPPGFELPGFSGLPVFGLEELPFPLELPLPLPFELPPAPAAGVELPLRVGTLGAGFPLPLEELLLEEPLPLELALGEGLPWALPFEFGLAASALPAKNIVAARIAAVRLVVFFIFSP